MKDEIIMASSQLSKVKIGESKYIIKIVKKRWYYRFFSKRNGMLLGNVSVNICINNKGKVFVAEDSVSISEGLGYM